MPNPYFSFKQFTVYHDRSAMKVTTDACLFGAWVAGEIKDQADTAASLQLLDIGTGTGLLSLMIAQQLIPLNNKITIDAIELDKDAAEQAKQNIESTPWNKNINVITGDAKQAPFEKRYDIIISNPPFYEAELESGDLKKNIARHSPGLLITELFTIISRLLKPRGLFYLLLPYKRHDEIIGILDKYNLALSGKELLRQSTSHNYFRIMIAGCNGKYTGNEITEGEIAIWDEKQEYTPAFRRLLKEYYLYL